MGVGRPKGCPATDQSSSANPLIYHVSSNLIPAPVVHSLYTPQTILNYTSHPFIRFASSPNSRRRRARRHHDGDLAISRTSSSRSFRSVRTFIFKVQCIRTCRWHPITLTCQSSSSRHVTFWVLSTSTSTVHLISSSLTLPIWSNRLIRLILDACHFSVACSPSVAYRLSISPLFPS